MGVNVWHNSSVNYTHILTCVVLTPNSYQFVILTLSHTHTHTHTHSLSTPLTSLLTPHPSPIHSTEVCREPEIVKKCRHTLKLVPMNPHVRTYYIAVGSPRELDVSTHYNIHINNVLALYRYVLTQNSVSSVDTLVSCPFCDVHMLCYHYYIENVLYTLSVVLNDSTIVLFTCCEVYIW